MDKTRYHFEDSLTRSPSSQPIGRKRTLKFVDVCDPWGERLVALSELTLIRGRPNRTENSMQPDE